MNRMEQILSNLSVYIYRSFTVSHEEGWREHRIKAEHTLWSIRRGRLWIEADGQLFEAKQGDAVLFYPGCEYGAYTDEAGCSFGVVRFRLAMGSDMDLFYGQSLSGVAEGAGVADFIPQKMSERCSLATYSAFLSYLLRVIEIQQGEGARLFYPKVKAAPSAMQKALDHIHSDYRTVTVGELAGLLHLNEKSFITAFKKAVGLTPGRYIFTCKMRRAAQRLCMADSTVAEVAEELGFSDPFAFSKAFKRYYGDPPAVFKKNAATK